MVRYRFSGQELLADVSLFESHLIAEVERIVFRTARLIESQAKALAPVAELEGGNLRQSIETEKIDDLTYKVNVGANYAIYVEFGTGIHASDGGGRQGGWVYFDEKLQEFRHTFGNKPQPFWFPALEQGERYFNREMERLF